MKDKREREHNQFVYCCLESIFVTNFVYFLQPTSQLNPAAVGKKCVNVNKPKGIPFLSHLRVTKLIIIAKNLTLGYKNVNGCQGTFFGYGKFVTCDLLGHLSSDSPAVCPLIFQ